MPPLHVPCAGETPRQRWQNPLTDGRDFRWDVLVAVPDQPPGTRDAVLRSIGTREANTVVHLPAASCDPGRGPNLAHAVGCPLPDLLDGMDVAVVSGDALSVHLAVRSGVPVVVLPTTAAQEAVGRVVASAGVGVVVRSATEVGPAVREVAMDPARRRRMRSLARRSADVDVLLQMLATPAIRPARRTGDR
jgi:UDP:flavonoid glycosyltransferase YjiC (YdhE family)